MSRNIYDVAKENLKNKKRLMITMIVGVLLFCLLFSYWLANGQSLVWPWLFIVPIVLLTFFLINHFDGKIVKKDPILEEMEKLNRNPNVGSEKMDSLDLKEIIPKYRDDELV